ncbi:E3 ubiquitin-protein ligase At1g63170 isoform X2 [Alnus glutinosa]|uniref:E3 ubiquitin-protein ligase At1g63170 isoform X2 n=1 Tax=Alnus glutinosa TaxID=3517 RepID=UPI002D7894C3|nr:E3 ubiquitin-protein ligase At1g63170 isoform X2 [Alnus glutinosa]
MDDPSLETNSSAQTDQYPLLMEHMGSHNDHEHIIDISRNGDASSSSSHDDQPPRMDSTQHEDRPSSGTRPPTYQTSLSSSNRLNSRTSSFRRRGDGYGRRRRSPLNSGLWISVELVVTGTEQDSPQSRQGSSQSNTPEPTSYTAISATQSLDEENIQTSENFSRNNQLGTLSARLNGLVDHFKMALDCFFAVWFVVGNVWIFGGHSSPSDAPKLYRLCIVFLSFSCIGYAMPFILCATICCCLPCIISILGSREDLSQTRGATPESINALPTYKFKLKKNGNVEDQEINSGVNEGGVLAAGTEKERAISGEDAVCCICLAKYADDEELRELPCFHVFHMECVDKWLKINALCPLCKSVIGECSATSLSARDSSQH